ncbi:MAG TPA: HAD-IG family 5'-nucleotidase [Polyangia bacterium]|nr:HAD-IG family 5'-nucleotidase [Polyangia bacterium]
MSYEPTSKEAQGAIGVAAASLAQVATPADGVESETSSTRTPDLQSIIGSIVPRANDIKRSRRVFVNRNLRLDRMEFIGFDMDYTLAIYNQPRIETLSITCTLDKLVHQRGYPEEILNLDYDPSWAIRGLVIDRQNGNIFKMDRYGHAGRVYHGRHKLSKEEKRKLYQTQRIRLSSPRYAWIDTLFALPEAVMFARIVDYLDENPRAPTWPGRPRYARLWKDIRESIDEAHRDESMKRVIKANLDEFLERDSDLAATLHKLRSAGKRLFLLTNSYWDYTDKVMAWLLDGQLPTYPSWRSYFDVIIVGGQKPSFFTERHPFVELDEQGQEKRQLTGPFQRGRIYQGGNASDLETFMGATGDRILYIGDHIYGDMLRAKKSSVWRTAMIIQELEGELTLAEAMSAQLRRIEELEKRRNRAEAELAYFQLVLHSLQRIENSPPEPGPAPAPGIIEKAKQESLQRLDQLRTTLREIGGEVESLEREVDRAFNPWWGALFKQGVENSRFGEQVEDYACVYTSRVSNLLAYSPLYYFRSPRDHMPHEL